MVRILILAAATVFVLLSLSAAQAADEPSRYTLDAGVDAGFVRVSGHPSWIDGSAGKLRYSGATDGPGISQAYLDYRLSIADTVNARVVGQYYDDDPGSAFDVSQAYLEWRPATVSANRYRLKAGAFYPRISLENTGPAWTSPYTISSSAINTWVGEEIRIVGAELSVSRRPQSLGGAHTFSLQAAAFMQNDPMGGLIAWKGWSVHDRQSRLGDALPLPPLPQIDPDGLFWRQDPVFIPFQENDDRVGWYVNGEWQYGNRLLLRVARYDNRADPRSVVNGQYGWYTKFSHVGGQLQLPGDVGLIFQYMDGTTVMGPVINGAYVVDVEYYSNFVLLTKSMDRHRISARYDHFEIAENDRIPLDENAERGHAWTFAYQYAAADWATLAAEWLQIYSHRPAWAYNDLSVDKTERQLQLSLRLRFGRH